MTVTSPQLGVHRWQFLKQIFPEAADQFPVVEETACASRMESCLPLALREEIKTPPRQSTPPPHSQSSQPPRQSTPFASPSFGATEMGGNEKTLEEKLAQAEKTLEEKLAQAANRIQAQSAEEEIEIDVISGDHGESFSE
jgi:hypothetical protein